MSTLTVAQAFQLAIRHHQAGLLAEAETLYQGILAVQPEHADAWHYLGMIAHQRGNNDLALEWVQKAANLNPDDAATHSNLGIVLAQTGRFEEAIVAFRRAVSLQPAWPEALNNLGLALYECAQLEASIEVLNQALNLREEYPEAHINLGIALRAQGKLEDAVKACRRALELNPNSAEAWSNMGVGLSEQGRIDEAMAAFREAIRLSPQYARAWNNLGHALKESGDLDTAVAAFRRSVQLDPTRAATHSNLLYTLLFLPGDHSVLLAEEHRNWNRQFGRAVGHNVGESTRERESSRRLRVGYLSSDLRDHVVGRNLIPLFRNHCRDDFEIFVYSDVIRADSLTEEIRQFCDRWRDTTGLGNEALANAIRTDGVDILVELNQHLAGNRLPMLAYHPAPVQVSFAGYPESVALDAISYRISDRWLETGGASNEDGLLVKTGAREKVYLLDSFWCYDPCGVDLAINEASVLESRWITFGSLNNFCKVNDPLLKLWARVLKAVEGARLIILSREGSHRLRILRFFETEGVEAHRIEFATPGPRQGYLELYHRLDVVLDTFPYNGHTTNLDALWMGVPVVSLCGEAPVSRAGFSQLSNLGLSEFVASTGDEYVETATRLAGDIPRLKELRATLRSRMEKSVLMDAPHFARQIEGCYRSMWRSSL